MRRQVSPTGLALWTDLPGTDLQIMWAGPGSRLIVGQCSTPGGVVSIVNHPTADAAYTNLKDATAAVKRFVAALERPA